MSDTWFSDHGEEAFILSEREKNPFLFACQGCLLCTVCLKSPVHIWCDIEGHRL